VIKQVKNHYDTSVEAGMELQAAPVSGWQSSMAGIYFVCRICPAQFNRLMDLEQHMVEAHNAYIPKYLEGGRE